MKEAKYQIVYETIKNDIVNGVYKYGEKLPSKRVTAEEFGVSVITVEHAFAMLCDEGYADSREKSGYFASFNAGEYIQGLQKKTDSFSYAEHISELDSSFPFSVYSKTMRRVLSARGSEIFDKCPPSGAIELKTAIARYLQRSRGIDVEPRQIVIGAGAEYLYGIIVQMLGKGKNYAAEKPSYEKIEQVYRANGVNPQMLSLQKDGISSSELWATGATVLHITPYRSYPTGVTASASKCAEYIKWVKAEKGRIIVEDDFGSEFSPHQRYRQTVFSLEGGRRVIYINTFSMTISPGIRIAYMILPPELLKRFEEKVGFYSCTVPLYNQLVLAEFIENGDFERAINRKRRRLKERL